MLSLISNSPAVAPGVTVPFSGIGGIPPYIYDVAPGGAGGTIDSNGLYTAPAITGTDTVEVTDSVNSVSELSILIGTPLELFCDVIQQFMGLSQGQVYLWDQKINIPTDSRLYIAVSNLSCKPFSNTRYFNNGISTQMTNMSATLSVDIFSRSGEARDRKEEVILAFNSQYSESQQELNTFRIFPISTSFLNISEQDGSAILYRYQIAFQVQYCFTKAIATSYYDSFSLPTVTGNS